MSYYKGRFAFITGGSEGIGLAIAQELVKQQASVVILSRSQDKLNKALNVLKALRTFPEQIIEASSIDVTDAKATEAALTLLLKKYGTPYFLIQCAGYARPGYISDLSTEHYQQMMNLNYFGILNTVKPIIPSMIQKKEGHIINTSSMAGFIGLFGYTGYCASKYAVVGFSEALRAELEPYKIAVSVLCPPNTETPGLEEENKFKPPEVLKLEEKAKPVTAEAVAKATITKLPKRDFFIHPTFDGKMAHVLGRFTPALLKQFTKRPNL